MTMETTIPAGPNWKWRRCGRQIRALWHRLCEQPKLSFRRQRESAFAGSTQMASVHCRLPSRYLRDSMRSFHVSPIRGRGSRPARPRTTSAC